MPVATPMRLFLAIVVAPFILYASYLLGVQVPSYVCEFRVIVHKAQEGSGQGLPQLPGIGLPAANAADSYAVIQYLESSKGVEDINRQVNLRRLFSAPNIDWPSRLMVGAPHEVLTRYWRGMLDAYYENTTNTVVVRVRAYTPTDALSVSTAALRASEQLVNEMTERSRQDLLAYSQRDVVAAATALQATNARLRAVRDQRQLIDPQLVAKVNLEQQAQLQAELIKANADLEAHKRYSPGSPTLASLTTRIGALQASLRDLQARSTGRGDNLAGALTVFDRLKVDQDFAQKRYEQALATQEKLKAQAAQQQLYLDMIFGPSLPEEADSPRVARSLCVFALFATCAWITVNLALKSYRERM